MWDQNVSVTDHCLSFYLLISESSLEKYFVLCHSRLRCKMFLSFLKIILDRTHFTIYMT